MNNLSVNGSKAFTKVTVQKVKAGFEITIIAGWGTSAGGFTSELDKYQVQSASQIPFNTYYGPKVSGSGFDYTPYITLTPPFTTD